MNTPSSWKDLPTNVIHSVISYLPRAKLQDLSLTCRRWNLVLIPILFESLPKQIYKTSFNENYLSKYGKMFLKLNYIEESQLNDDTINQISQNCPNLAHFCISQKLLEFVKGLDWIVTNWPRVNVIELKRVNLPLGKLNQFKSLKRLVTFNCPTSLLDSIESPLHEQIDNLDFVYLTLDISSLMDNLLKFTSINSFSLRINPLNRFRLEELHTLLSGFSIWSRLQHLRISISLKKLKAIRDTNKLDFYFPSTFKINQLKSLKLDFNIKYNELASDRNLDLPNDPLFAFGPAYSLNPSAFIDLFNSPCDLLTVLHLPIIDESLLIAIARRCPNLVELSFDSLLPLLSVPQSIFEKLKRLSVGGLTKRTIQLSQNYHHTFPNVHEFSVTNRMYTNWPEIDYDWTNISYLFPELRNLILHSIVYRPRTRKPAGIFNKLNTLVVAQPQSANVCQWLRRYIMQFPELDTIIMMRSSEWRDLNYLKEFTLEDRCIQFYTCQLKEYFDVDNVLCI